jgi:hypothetical protein
MLRPLLVLAVVAGSLLMVGAGCSSSSNPGAPDGAMTPAAQSEVDAGVDASTLCKLGGPCSTGQICNGGVSGCESNCQCLGGTWEAPCPAALPTTGTACTPAGAECGYTTTTNACGAANCYCQSGTWNCGPSCAIVDAGDTGADATPDGSSATECHWPASLNDAGPGACAVGRAYVSCSYPTGVSCEGGGGASSKSGVSMGCISDDPTSCEGCGSTSGAATCKSICAPNEYAVSCGGPPHPSNDGGPDEFVYQQAPANCRDVGVTPGGNQYSCCPCE